MKKSKKLLSFILLLTMIVSSASMASAAVSNVTDISEGVAWKSYSIHTREDNGYWEDMLIGAGQKYQNKENTYKSYGEDAKITTQTSSSFTMNVVSTGWSATWTPMGTVGQSNPWGVTAYKVVNVKKGFYYTISFKIKSTLKNEIMKSQDKKDAKGNVIRDSEGSVMGENVGTGKYNYVKHIHFKAYDNTDKDGAALKLSNVKATIGGKSVLSSTEDFNPLIALDSRNTVDDGYVTVTADVKIGADYQIKQTQATLGIKFLFGSLLKEFPDEYDMSGTVEVKDFHITVAESTLPKGAVAPKNFIVTREENNGLAVNFEETEEQKLMNQKYNVYIDNQLLCENEPYGKYIFNNVKAGFHKVTLEAIYNNTIAKAEKNIYLLNGKLTGDWIGANESTIDSWNLTMEQIGNNGALSKTVSKNFFVKTDSDYNIQCTLTSYDGDKWVYMGVKDQNDTFLWGKWIYLTNNSPIKINEIVKLSRAVYINNATVVFGVGGEFGNSNEEKNVYGFLNPNQNLNDMDSEKRAGILCQNIKIEETSVNNQKTTIPNSNETTTFIKKAQKINVNKTSIKSIKGAKKSIKLIWKKISGASGYQIRYSMKSNFKGAKHISVKRGNVTNCIIKKLKKKKVYYIKVRVFLKKDGTVYYSKWSKVKRTKTK